MTTSPVITQHGAWQLATAQARAGESFYAWAKEGLITGDDPLAEPGDDVWFEFGASHDEARARLLRELGLLS